MVRTFSGIPPVHRNLTAFGRCRVVVAAMCALLSTGVSAQSIEILANQLFGIESEIYLCRSTASVVDFMALLPRARYRAMAAELPRDCRIVPPDNSSVALIRVVEKFGIVADAAGLVLRPFLVVVVDAEGQRTKGVSFLSADIKLRENDAVPGSNVAPAESLREFLGE